MHAGKPLLDRTFDARGDIDVLADAEVLAEGDVQIELRHNLERRGNADDWRKLVAAALIDLDAPRALRLRAAERVDLVIPFDLVDEDADFWLYTQAPNRE